MSKRPTSLHLRLIILNPLTLAMILHPLTCAPRPSASGKSFVPRDCDLCMCLSMLMFAIRPRGLWWLRTDHRPTGRNAVWYCSGALCFGSQSPDALIKTVPKSHFHFQLYASGSWFTPLHLCPIRLHCCSTWAPYLNIGLKKLVFLFSPGGFGNAAASQQPAAATTTTTFGTIVVWLDLWLDDQRPPI